MYATYAVASIDSNLFFDFEDITGMIDDSATDKEDLDTNMSPTVVLLSWAFLGTMTGLISYFVYGFYVQISGHEAFGGGGANKDIIQAAKSEQEMACKLRVLAMLQHMDTVTATYEYTISACLFIY